MTISRRKFLGGLGAAALVTTILPLRAAMAMGEEDRFTLAQLQYGPGWNPRPSALRRLLLEVEKRTSVEVMAETPAITGLGPALFEHPILVWAGDRGFDPFSEGLVDNLRRYLFAGGFLYVDNCEGLADGPFMQGVRRELGRILPGKKLEPVSRDHVVYKSFYLVDAPYGRLDVGRQALGVTDEDRLAVVVNPNDLLGALARDSFGKWVYDVSPGGERQREMAYRLGVNLVLYALTVNYKADQVHVPFILRRRKWKVEDAP